MERYLGIDVHRDSSTVCVLSATGKQVRKEVVETSGPTLITFLKQLSGSLRVCIEESPWSEWLYEILSPHVAEIVVYQSQWTPGAKSDAIDAQGLAEKLRVGKAGPGVFKAPKRYRQLREWAHVYQALNHDVMRSKTRFKSHFIRRGIRCSGSAVYAPGQRDDWIRQLPVVMRPTAQLLGTEVDRLLELKREAEASLLEESRRHPIWKILQTAPGLGPIRTALLVATVITPHRFRSKRQFWSYCGFGVVTRSSSDWIPSQGGWIRARSVQTRGLNRNHNPTLKGIFKGAAVTAVNRLAPDHPLRLDYTRLCDNGTRPHLAKITIARKIAAAVLAMWKKKEVYNPAT